MAFERDLSLLDRSITIDQGSINALNRALDRLPEQLRKSAEKAVLRAGAKVLLKSARAKVPVRKSDKNIKGGTLKKSLGVSVSSGKYGATARVGPRTGFKYPKQKTGRRGKGKGKAIDAQEVAFYIETGTPRMAAKPFIRPAIDESKDAIVDAMAAGLDKHLTRVAARLAKK